jgi:hypothetical protein
MSYGNTLKKIVKWDDCKKMYIVFTVTMTLIVVVWILFVRGKTPEDDPMNRIVVRDVPLLGSMSWWPISHFILFFFLGLFFSQCWAPALTAGVLWEIWEHIFGRYILKETESRLTDGNVQYGIWWSGSMTDIFMNVAGFVAGALIAKLFSTSPTPTAVAQ